VIGSTLKGSGYQPGRNFLSSRKEFSLCSYVTYTCDLSHHKYDVLSLAAALLNLCNRGGMKSFKKSKGRSASKRVGNHCFKHCKALAIVLS